jgi:hypothetical protein
MIIYVDRNGKTGEKPVGLNEGMLGSAPVVGRTDAYKEALVHFLKDSQRFDSAVVAGAGATCTGVGC